VKFVFEFGETKSQLQKIPWANVFSSSKILVVGLDENGDIMAICGIRSIFNILTLYVCRDWRGRGIGYKILKETIGIARERHLGFIMLGVFCGNVRAFHLYSKFGFEEVVFLKRRSLRIMMLPMNFVGEVAYLFICAITFLLPNLFWTYVAQWIHNATVNNGHT